jgi:trehalose-phosphatase
MLRLIEEYPRLENRILAKRFLFIGLDYDGTLTPIVRHPDRAELSKDTKSLLADLCHLPNTFVCIISGRSYQDVRRKVGVGRIIYAGNHGMEIKGPGVSLLVGDSKRIAKGVSDICRTLNQRLKGITGVWVENKGLTASVHYRLAESEDIQRAKSIALPLIKDYAGLHFARGKKVWEIRPNLDWNKGKAIDFILKENLTRDWRKKTAVVYVGDDQTDEDAFSFLGKSEITVLINEDPRRNSKAKYFLAHQREVIKFLTWLKHVWEGEVPESQSNS